MLSVSDEQKRSLRDRLGLKDGKPVVLYAPTWRGTPDDVTFDFPRLKQDLNALGEKDCHILFRGHNYLEEKLASDTVGSHIVPSDVDTNELLSIVDTLITDYSSIFFDFLPLGKPIIHYLYDLKEYERQRGLYFTLEAMPGYTCLDHDDLSRAIDSALRDGIANPARHSEARAEFCPYDDGQATQRVIDFFFGDEDALVENYRRRDRPCILFASGGFAASGITTSFVNLVNTIDRGQFDIILGFAPETIEASPLRLTEFRKLPGDICTVARHGNVLMSLDEQAVWDLEQEGVALSESAKAIRDGIFAREFVRVFGTREIDTAISYAGYDPFWTGVMVANKQASNKVVYLHNDMTAEKEARFPELSRTFDLYRQADKLISASVSTNTVNKAKLAEKYGLPVCKFDHCDNLIDAPAILAGAAGALASVEHEALFEGQGPVFVTVGRLSVEKDHAKLIRSFASVAVQTLSARLLILGTGPLEPQLRALVDELGLGKRVHLLGHCSNPHAYVKRADCFVLSSNHEGQGLVLLEAMLIGTPIVSTDIEGVRSVLAGTNSLCVPNTEEGLRRGMKACIRGELRASPFNAEAYNERALRRFYLTVLGSQ
jgi:CDP-glycerol glycerophosphotransferase